MAEKQIGIYSITCTVNGKQYVGQSIDIDRRKNQHRHSEQNPRLRADIEKYGWDAFKFEILEECLKKELTAKELHYLELLKPAYNIRINGHTLSEEGLLRLIKSKRGKKFTSEHCANISKSKRGQKIFAIRKPILCVETGKIFQGIVEAAESCNAKRSNISKVLNGLRDTAGGYSWRYCDEPLLQKRADKIRAERHAARQNKKINEAFLNANKQTIQCVETGNFFSSISLAAEIFENIRGAAKHFSIYPETISRVLRGLQKTAGGYHWERVEEEIFE